MPINPEEFISVLKASTRLDGEYVYDSNPEPAIARRVKEMQDEDTGRRITRVTLIPQFQGPLATGELVMAHVDIDAETNQVVGVANQSGGRRLWFRKGTEFKITGGLEPRLANRFGSEALNVQIIPPRRIA